MKQLTNEQAKREANEMAWGEHWPMAETWVYPFDDGEGEIFFKDLYENGVLQMNFVPLPLRKVLYFDMFENLNGIVWPKSLANLRTNNGWTRIEPDGSNLPTSGVYRVWYGDNNYCDACLYVNHTRQQWIYENLEIFPTHYKPIDKELPPIY